MPGLKSVKPPGKGMIDEFGEKYAQKRKGLSISMLGTNPEDEKAANIIQEQLKEQRERREKQLDKIRIKFN